MIVAPTQTTTQSDDHPHPLAQHAHVALERKRLGAGCSQSALQAGSAALWVSLGRAGIGRSVA